MAMEMVAAAWKDVGWSVHGWLEDWFYPADGFGADAGSGDPAYNERDRTRLVHMHVVVHSIDHHVNVKMHFVNCDVVFV